MPKRPPRRWINSCIQQVEARSDVDDAGAVCGSVWHHKLSDADRRRIARREERRMQENPLGDGGGLILLGLGLGIGALILLSQKKPAKASTKPVPRVTPQPQCPIAWDKLLLWQTERKMGALYLQTTPAPPPTLPKLKEQYGQAVTQLLQNNATIVVVMQDGSFWTYPNQVDPKARPDLKADYCAYKPPV